MNLRNQTLSLLTDNLVTYLLVILMKKKLLVKKKMSLRRTDIKG